MTEYSECSRCGKWQDGPLDKLTYKSGQEATMCRACVKQIISWTPDKQ